MSVDMRAMGERNRPELAACVRDLNVRLHRKATRKSLYSAKLTSRSMLSIYTVQLDEKDDDGHRHFVVSLAFDFGRLEQASQHRRLRAARRPRRIALRAPPNRAKNSG